MDDFSCLHDYRELDAMAKKRCDWTALVVKASSDIAVKTALSIKTEADSLGEEIRIPYEFEITHEGFSDTPRFSLREEEPCRIIVVGGDGTLLRLLQYEGSTKAVIATIGAGRRCYFFDIDNTEALGVLARLIKGDYVEHRMWRLSVNACEEYTANALNEIVIIGDSTRISSLSVHAGPRKIYEFSGDGIIIATTQGSTAYSLSAGGPIVDPLLTSMVITPVNSTALNIRPIVVEPFATITVKVPARERRLRLVIDGIGYGSLPPGCKISVRLGEKPIRLARFRWVRFYEKLF